MRKGEHQKLKMLYLAKILEGSSYVHTLSMSDIISSLKSYGVNADRKTIYQDLAELRFFGLEIRTEKGGRSTRYYLDHPYLDVDIFNLLVDLINQSDYLLEKERRFLIQKIMEFSNHKDSDPVSSRQLIRRKGYPSKAWILSNMDTIYEAIHRDQQIAFHYYPANIKYDQSLHNSFYAQNVSPLSLIWDNGYYYLLACHDNVSPLMHFRVDKMTVLSIQEDKRVGTDRLSSYLSALEKNDYRSIFLRDLIPVRIRFHRNLIGILADQFGENLDLLTVDNEYLETTIDVVLSPQFLGWIISFGNGIQVLGPDLLIDQISDLLKSAETQYGHFQK